MTQIGDKEKSMSFNLNAICGRNHGAGNVKLIYWYASKMLPDYVYDIAKYEGTTYTFSQILTQIDGINVGGKSVEESFMINGLSRAYKCMLSSIFEGGELYLNHVHELVSFGLVPKPGQFRDRDVQIRGCKYHCIDCSYLPSLAATLLPPGQSINDILSLYCALIYYQFFLDCNKRTARIFCNYHMIKNGHGILAIAHNLKEQYNDKLVILFEQGNPEPMIEFLKYNCLMLFDGDNLIKNLTVDPTKVK